MGPANQQLAPVYNPAVSNIQAQIPAIQQLYANLLQGLQGQAQTQAQNVVASAQQRGVDRPMLANDLQGAFAQTLALQGAQLGAQQAGDIAGVQGQVGQTNVGRAQAVMDLVNSLKNESIAKRTNQLQIGQMNAQARLAKEKAQQDYNVQAANYATQQARAAARASAKADTLTTGQALLTVGKLWQPGADGYVNPKQWNELREAWMAAGYGSGAFDSEFGALVNPNHQYRDSKLQRYKGIGLKD